MNNPTILDIKEKYRSMRKGEKHDFLQYLAKEYDCSPFTVTAKLRNKPGTFLRPMEAEVMLRVFESNEWRRKI